MGVYLSLSKSYVERTMQEANKRAMKQLHGEENCEDLLLWTFDKEPEVEIGESENDINLNSDTPIGFISLDAEMDIDTQIGLVEKIVKRLNKFKNLLESLK